MKQASRGFGWVSFMIAAPLILIGVGLLVAGWRTAPDELTTDGYSQRLFFFIGGGVFLASGLGVVLFSLGSSAGARVEERQRREIDASWKKAAARIQKIEPGTKLGNEDWKPVLLTLEVVVPGRSPYQVTWDGEVEATYAGQLRPDEWLRVMVSPKDPKQLQIRWGEPAEPPATAPH